MMFHKFMLACLASLASVCATASAAQDNQPADLVAEAWRAINDRYYDTSYGGANWEQIADAFIHQDYDDIDAAHQAVRRMLSSLQNPSTRFLTPSQASAMIAELGGDLGSGVGLPELLCVDIDEQQGGIVIVTPVADTPAVRSGLRTGDRLLRIDDAPVEGMALADVMSMLRGPAGSTVEIQYRRGDKVRSVTVTRDDLGPISAVDTRIVAAEDLSIGYVRVSLFDASTFGEFARGLDTLRAEDVNGIVLDLRNNPGGRLDALQEIAGALLGPLPLARVTGREGVRTLAADGDRRTDLPLIVLINEGTASAAEMLAAALSHHDRARLVGAKSFGKGLAHGFAPLPDGSGVMFTMGRIETLDGADILTEGVSPDIEIRFEPHPVVDPDIDAAGENDAPFWRAVDVIRQRLAAP